MRSGYFTMTAFSNELEKYGMAAATRSYFSKRCPECPESVILLLGYPYIKSGKNRPFFKEAYPRIEEFKHILPSAAIRDVTSFYELMFVQHQREGKGANAQEKSYLPIANSFCCVHQGTFENANIKSG